MMTKETSMIMKEKIWLLLLVVVLCLITASEGKVTHRTLPYRDVEICNESPSKAQLEMLVTYESRELLLKVDELAAESCVIVEVLPGVHYSAWTEGDRQEMKESKRQLFPTSHEIQEGVDKYVFSSSPAGDSPKVLSPQKAGKDSKPSSNFNTSSYVWPLTAAERVSDKIRIKVWNLLNKEILLLVEDTVQNVYNNAGQIRPYDEEYVMIKAGDMLCISMTATPTMIYDKITPDPNEPLVILRDDSDIPKEVEARLSKRLSFQDKYHKKTGKPWVSYFSDKPRPPVNLHYWPANYLGQKHVVQTTADYLTSCGSVDKKKSKKDSSICHTTDRHHVSSLELEVISTKPKVFLIRNFLHPEEAERIMTIATPYLQTSAVGTTKTGSGQQEKVQVRKSSTAWLPYFQDVQIRRLYERSADVLGIPIDKIRSRRHGEDLQVVRYSVGEKYDGHYDWGDYGVENTRCITLLIYLTNQSDPDAGGETAFLKASYYNNQTKKREVGFKVHPGAGSAVLFYNMLEDGNGDDLTLHAALPVKRGTKWLANLWIWDPYFQKDYHDQFSEL